MTVKNTGMPYRSLVEMADRILDRCEEDVACIAACLDRLDEPARGELLVSDLLNAYQAFYYFFRTDPGELARERMELEPASSLPVGLQIDACEFLDLVFLVKEHAPVIIASDGEQAVATFTGASAYAQGLAYIRNPENNS